MITTDRFVVVKMNHLHWGVVDLQPNGVEHAVIVVQTGRSREDSETLAARFNQRGEPS